MKIKFDTGDSSCVFKNSQLWHNNRSKHYVCLTISWKKVYLLTSKGSIIFLKFHLLWNDVEIKDNKKIVKHLCIISRQTQAIGRTHKTSASFKRLVIFFKMFIVTSATLITLLYKGGVIKIMMILGMCSWLFIGKLQWSCYPIRHWSCIISKYVGYHASKFRKVVK